MLTSKPKFINILISLSLLLLIVNPALSNSSNCSYTWTPQNSNTLNPFYTVEAVSEMVCWTAGGIGIVRRTTDGGITWFDANPNPGVLTGNITDIEAIDGNTAWIASTQSINTWIFKTTNGGNTWFQVYNNTYTYVNGVHMTSPDNGFAFADPISQVWNILTTSNGGMNWTQLPGSPPGPPPAQGFRNSFQVMLPYIWFASYPALIIRSTNSGLNWTQHTVPGSGMATIFSIQFNSPSLGFTSSINMAKSTDAGVSYSQQPVPGIGNISAIEGSGSEYWYVRGQYIYHSTDSGENWTQVHNAGISLSDIDIPDNMSGCLTAWAVGFGGKIIKMTANLTGIGSENTEPKEYSLEQNYPNPFNPTTVISYSIPKAGQVKLSLYDITGKVLKVITDEYKSAGTYNMNFDASEYSTGLYIYKLESGEFRQSKKMILIK